MKMVDSGTVFSPLKVKGRVVGVGAVALSLLATAPQAQAADSIWDISATTAVDLSFTDNVLLESVDPDSDFVIGADGTVLAMASTARSQVYFSYTLGFNAYVDTSGLNGTYHSLSTANTFEVLPGFLSIGVNGSVQERDSVTDLRSPAVQRTINNRRTRISSLTVSPRIDRNLGNWSNLVFNAAYGLTDYSNPDVGTNTVQDDDQIWSSDFRLANLDKGNQLGWEFYGNARGDDDDFRSYEVGGLLRMELGRDFDLLVRGGHDTTEGRRTGYDIDEMYWRAGVDWQPLRYFSIRAEAGERYGGPSYDGTIQYTPSDLLNLTVSYVQELDTNQGRLFRDNLNLSFDDTGTVISDPTIDNDIRSDTSISETWRATLSGAIGKTSYALSAYQVNREFDVIDPLTLEPEEDETVNVNFSLSRQFGKRTNGYLNAFYSDNDTATDVASIEGYGGTVGVSYQVGHQASIGLSYSYQNREDRLGNDVEENAFLLSVSQRW